MVFGIAEVLNFVYSVYYAEYRLKAERLEGPLASGIL